MRVAFHDLGSIEDEKITFVVMASRFEGQWILVRHGERSTLEIPGGHREEAENLEEAARRELFEETGAMEFELYPVCIYSVADGGKVSFGMLYFAEIRALGRLPRSEIDEVFLETSLPLDNLTYPAIQPLLHGRVMGYLGLVG